MLLKKYFNFYSAIAETTIAPIVVMMVMQYTALLMNVHALSPLYVMPASCATCNSSSNVLSLLRASDFQSSSLCSNMERGEDAA